MNLIAFEVDWLADAAAGPTGNDKPWDYRYEQNIIANYITANAIKVAWLGGDRHFVGYLAGASNTLGGFPCFTGSGFEKNSLDLNLGETQTWQHGANRHVIQTVVLGGTALPTSFTLTYSGQTTEGIAVNATAATVQAALIALSSIGPDNVLVTGADGGPWTVRFIGTLNQNSALMTGTPTGGTDPTVTVYEEKVPVMGYMQLVLSFVESTGLVSLNGTARVVADTTSNTDPTTWTISTPSGMSSTETWTP